MHWIVLRRVDAFNLFSYFDNKFYELGVLLEARDGVLNSECDLKIAPLIKLKMMIISEDVRLEF